MPRETQPPVVRLSDDRPPFPSLSAAKPMQGCTVCGGSHPDTTGGCTLPFAKQVQIATDRILQHMEPAPWRLFVSKPRAGQTVEVRVSKGGLITPVRAANALREFALICTIKKVSPEAYRMGFRPCHQIAVMETAGTPIWMGVETDIHIIGTGDIIARLKGNGYLGDVAVGTPDPRPSSHIILAK